ncbi:MAG: ATP-binding protein, partial [Gemmatimonadaceae bacterium]
ARFEQVMLRAPWDAARRRTLLTPVEGKAVAESAPPVTAAPAAPAGRAGAAGPPVAPSVSAPVGGPPPEGQLTSALPPAWHRFDPSLTVSMDRAAVVGESLRPPAGRAGAASAEAERDDLTGVLVRRAFIARAEGALAAAARHERGPEGAPLSLLVIDVDHFKLVNDTYGHLQGDDVLRSVAAVFAALLNERDVVGRYAGDEFVILLPEASAEAACEVAERLRIGVQRAPCPLRDRPAGSGAVAVTLSIGVATAPGHGLEFEALFAAADRALYDAKRRGRNAVGVADGAPGADAAAPRLDFERFVGRTTQLRRLVKLLESSARGEPSVVAIVGEAGVGKSTLLRQLAPEVRLRAGALVRGRCLEADVRPPYGAWADVISALHQTGAVPPRPDGRPWRELPRIVPELLEETALAAAPEPGAAAVEAAAGKKYVLVDEIAEYLRAAAAACPVVIVLDDMQWADAATWDTLEHLLPLVTSDRLLVCLTIRAEDAGGDVAGRRLRLVRDERFNEIPLERLTVAEVSQWIEGVFQGQTIGRAAVDFIYEHSEGNPLLVAQLLRTLVEEGAIVHVDGRWRWRPSGSLTVPVAVGDVMSRRLARLSPEARTILVSAAVVGRVFDVSLVVAAGAAAEDDVLDAVDEAVAAAVLEPVGGAARDAAAGQRYGDDRYTFTHALLVTAVLRSANPRRLRRIHERVAQVLEARSPAAVADIAVHYDRAEVKEKAHHYGLLAGARAAGLHAHDEAAAFYTMAHRHAGSLAQLAEVRFRLAGVAESAGRYAEAEGLCDMAVAWLEEQRGSALCFAARRMRERLRALQGQPPQRTLAACRELLAEAEAAGAESERVALLTMISQAHSRLGELPEAERIARECLTLAEAAADGALLSEACMRLGNTLLETRPLEAVGLYTRALESFSEAADRYGQARCYINTGIAQARAGDGRAAEKAYVIALDLSRSAHAPDLAGLAALNLGVLYIRDVRFDEADERLREALELFTAVKNQHHRLGTLYNLAHLARERGESAAALDLYMSVATLARTIGHTDVEIGALAGAGLTGLALGKGEVSVNGLRAGAALIGDRADWWFQGRELHEALAVRLGLADGQRPLAAARFAAAHALAARHDPYGASWLVSECAPLLSAAGDGAARPLAEHYAREARERGYLLLAARYSAAA